MRQNVILLLHVVAMHAKEEEQPAQAYGIGGTELVGETETVYRLENLIISKEAMADIRATLNEEDL